MNRAADAMFGAIDAAHPRIGWPDVLALVTALGLIVAFLAVTP